MKSRVKKALCSFAISLGRKESRQAPKHPGRGGTTEQVPSAVLGLLLTVSLSPVLFFHQEPQMTFSQSAGSGVPRQGCEVEDACSPDQFDYYSGVDQGGEQ